MVADLAIPPILSKLLHCQGEGHSIAWEKGVVQLRRHLSVGEVPCNARNKHQTEAKAPLTCVETSQISHERSTENPTLLRPLPLAKSSFGLTMRRELEDNGRTQEVRRIFRSFLDHAGETFEVISKDSFT